MVKDGRLLEGAVAEVLHNLDTQDVLEIFMDVRELANEESHHEKYMMFDNSLLSYMKLVLAHHLVEDVTKDGLGES